MATDLVRGRLGWALVVPLLAATALVAADTMRVTINATSIAPRRQ